MPPPHSEEARRFLRSIMPDVVISLMGFAYGFQEDGQPSTLSKVDRRRAGESLIGAGWVTRGELDTLTVPEAITRFGILNRTGLSDREPAQIEVPPVATMSKDEIRKLTPEQMRDAFEHQVRELERTKLLARARNLHRGSTRRKCTKRRYRLDLMYRR